MVTGSRFGKWLALQEPDHQRKILCRCECGTERMVNRYNLEGGKSISCGCGSKGPVKHGLASHPDYQLWKGMRARCNNPNHKSYPDYGGRGIKVCARWDDFPSFLADMGPRPGKEFTVDRIDGDGNYEPGNCRWATQTEQTRNTRRSKLVQVDGVTKTVAEWSELTGINSSVIYHRLAAGWPDAKALQST